MKKISWYAFRWKNICGELNDKSYLNKQMKLLERELSFMGIRPSNTINSNNANLQPPTGIFAFALLFSILFKFSFIILVTKYLFKHFNMIMLLILHKAL